jgi:hypothetical protein
MELYRLGIKFFASGERVNLTEFIPIFHEWIQKQNIDRHLLIDVHNYSHMHDGPGILLVAHEGNFSIDFDGRMGFVYYRKQPFQTLADIVKPAIKGCKLLSDDRRMCGRLEFSTDELVIFANDRLLAPNTEETFSELQPRLSAALVEVLGESFNLSRISHEPKERLTIHCRRGLD